MDTRRPDTHLAQEASLGRRFRTRLLAHLARLEAHLALPGDDETVRRRKVVAFFAGLAGVNTALLFAVLYFAGGAPLLGWLYVMTVVVSGLTLSYLVIRPRAYYACVLITATYVTIHPWVVGLASITPPPTWRTWAKPTHGPRR